MSVLGLPNCFAQTFVLGLPFLIAFYHVHEGFLLFLFLFPKVACLLNLVSGVDMGQIDVNKGKNPMNKSQRIEFTEGKSLNCFVQS